MPMLESSPSAAARDPQAPNSMFGNYTAAKLRKAPPWAGPVLAAAALLHIVVFAAMWAKSIWALEQLDKPKTHIDLAVAPPPPPPPPPPPGGAKPQEVQVTQKKVKVKDVVQPEKVEKQEHTPVPEAGDANGVEGGVEGGDPNGVADGVLGAPPPPPPPPPPPGAANGAAGAAATSNTSMLSSAGAGAAAAAASAAPNAARAASSEVS